MMVLVGCRYFAATLHVTTERAWLGMHLLARTNGLAGNIIYFMNLHHYLNGYYITD